MGPRKPALVTNDYNGPWNDLSKVPVSALPDLWQNIHDLLTNAGISTAGLLIAHSRQGLDASVYGHAIKREIQTSFGPHYLRVVEACLSQKGLRLAPDNTQVPLRFIIDHRHTIYKGYESGPRQTKWIGIIEEWSKPNQQRFIAHHNLITLGDLAKLQLTGDMWLPDRGSRQGPLDLTVEANREWVEVGLNMLLEAYGFEPLVFPVIQ